MYSNASIWFIVSPIISARLRKQEANLFICLGGLTNNMWTAPWSGIWSRWFEQSNHEGDFNLHFIHDKEKRDVDLLIANERVPFLLIECKLADEQPAKSLLAMQRALEIPAVQLVRSSPGFRACRNGELPLLVPPAAQWCGALPA
jgi:hypothetical protein